MAETKESGKPRTVKVGDLVAVAAPFGRSHEAKIVSLSRDGQTADLVVAGLPFRKVKMKITDKETGEEREEMVERPDLPNLKLSPRDDSGMQHDSWRPSGADDQKNA
jgi:hypothetical protein